MHEQRPFTALVSGGSRHRWVSMCTVWSLHSNEQVEQRICIKFCIMLEHSSVETIWLIQKASAMGNWWLAASSQHTLTHAHIPYRVQSFLVKHQITQVTQPPYSPGLVIYNFWLFPKLRSPFFIKDFSLLFYYSCTNFPHPPFCPSHPHSHSQFAHCCPCPRVIHIWSLTSPFPFFLLSNIIIPSQLPLSL